MNKDELIGLGDASVRKALADMFTVLNGNGEILVRIGDGDTMGFSPNLECDKDRSVVLFDDEASAQSAIDDVLSPQDDGEYHIFKFTSIGDEDGDEDEFDIIDDGDDAEIDVIDGDTCGDDDSCEECGVESETMSLDDAIEHAREVGTEMMNNCSDVQCGKEHLQLAKWLEELKALRSANGDTDEE